MTLKSHLKILMYKEMGHFSKLLKQKKQIIFSIIAIIVSTNFSTDIKLDLTVLQYSSYTKRGLTIF